MKKPASYCLFETPLGWCGIAWSEGPDTAAPYAVIRFQLPVATTEMTEERIRQTSGAPQPSPPPPELAEVIDRVGKHLRGETQTFRDVAVDLTRATVFARKVYEAAREIPAGRTITYADLANNLGQPNAARAVGQALGRNPIPLIIPCHRILAAGGKPGGFSAHGGRATKAKLLALEGAVVNLCLELGADG
jgi:O-6-methylguanine DNA methyltransferase